MTVAARNAELARATQADGRWSAVMARDAGADGEFVYSVRTTGVYCRPSCGARLARPENVQFHATCVAAERAGFRACKRCRPDQPLRSNRHTDTIAAVCRILEQSDTLPSLEQMAAGAGLSPFHFHRVFKSLTGLTPKIYAQAHRDRRVRAGLRRNERVTDVIYNAGFSSSGRFYESAGKALGMTPSRYRSGGSAERIHFAVAQCTLGAILVAATAKGVCMISLGDDPQVLVRELQDVFARADLIGADVAFEQVVAQVIRLIEAPDVGLDLPLDVRGTAFQQRVWQALRAIPLGQTQSYSEIAQHVGAPKAVRAVAQACAANVLAVAIPCHRVVRSNGALSGYRWGVERKRALLDRETK